jgi:hypothetical protein
VNAQLPQLGTGLFTRQRAYELSISHYLLAGKNDQTRCLKRQMFEKINFGGRLQCSGII